MLRRLGQLQTLHFQFGMQQEQGIGMQRLEYMIGRQGAAGRIDETGQCFMALRITGTGRHQRLVFDAEAATVEAFENAMRMDFGLRHIGFQKFME